MTTSQNLRPVGQKTRHADNRPQEIITAALAVFSEHGFAAARLEDVAQRAGITKSTIYLYFPSKEELFREVLRDTLIANVWSTAEMLPEGSATAQLRHFAERYWTMLRSPSLEALHRLLLSELMSYPELAHFYATQVVARAHRLIGEILTHGMATGEFRCTSARVGARLLLSTLIAQAFWCNNPTYFDRAAGIDDCVAVLPETLELILRGLAPLPRGT